MKTKKSLAAEKPTICEPVLPINDLELIDPLEMELGELEETELTDPDISELMNPRQDFEYSLLHSPLYKKRLRESQIMTVEELENIFEQMQMQRNKHDQAFLQLVILFCGLKLRSEEQLAKFHRLMPLCFKLKQYPFLEYESVRDKSEEMKADIKAANQFFTKLAEKQKLPVDKNNILSINKLLKEIAQLPSSKKLNGHFAKLIKLSQNIVQDEAKKQQLHSAWQELFKAKDELHFIGEMISNEYLKMVIFMAKRYRGRGLDMNDLIQAGNIGLHKAPDRYMPNHEGPRGKAKYSTYLIWWIKQSITRQLQDTRSLIRKPNHIHELLRTIMHSMNILQTRNPELTQEETIRLAGEELEMSPKKISKILELFKNPVSLNQPTDENNEAYIEDFIADANLPNPENRTVENNLSETVKNMLQDLTPRQRFVIIMRHGLNGETDHTLEEIGQMMQPPMTRERIRQIEAKAIEKLRNPKRVKILKPFLN